MPPSNHTLLTVESGIRSALMAIMVSLLLQGCTERPSAQIDVVFQAIQDARLAGAQDYAFEELEQAESSYHQALRELEYQDAQFAGWRTYSKLNEILELAYSQAQKAKSEALANLEETKSNAQLALAVARDQISQAQASLDWPDSPYPIAQQFNELKLTLERAKTLLDNMESSMGSGDYIQVMTSAHAVESLALTIHQRILAVLGQSPSAKVEV
ncbi:MAG: hypothetical protein KC590_00030 [Nitrospira sp.]|nr:hypothetical protein [Nitrospira sp.]